MTSTTTGSYRLLAILATLSVAPLSTSCVAGDAAGEGDEPIASEERTGEVFQALNTAPGEGLYRISPQNAPHKSWDLPGVCPGQSNGAALALYAYDGHGCAWDTGDQKWYIKYAGNDGQNFYEIRQGHANGKCLDIASAGGTDNLITWDCNGGNWQRWYFTETESMTAYGHWEIRSKHNGRAIDLVHGRTENATEINMWTDLDNSAQRWILKRVEAGNSGMIPNFYDDFTSLNTAHWNIADWNPGFVNNEEQYYKPWKVNIVDGRRLSITCHHIGAGTGMGNYECGRINSKGKRYYKEGAFSARIRYFDGGSLSVGTTGTWPAFWVLGNGINEHAVDDRIEWCDAACGSCISNWPQWGKRELDIFEYTRNSWDRYFTAGHAGDYCQNANITNGNGYSKADNWFDPNRWYVFKAVFDGSDVKFYRDGQLMFQFSNSAWLNQDMFYVLNMAVGGALGQNSDSFNGSDDWASMEVDWVAHEYWW